MNLKNIRALADIMVEKGLSMIDISEGELKIHLEKNIIIQKELENPFVVLKQQNNTQSVILPAEKELDFNSLNEVKSPMVGIYYSASSLDAGPFVKVGDKVKKGDTLCIIEAMKLMNDIVAETDGEIVDICVENGQVVEFSQVLFKMK